MRFSVAVGSVLLVAMTALSPAVAHADSTPPAEGSACPAEFAGAMTLLPDEQTYAVCAEQAGLGFRWAAVQTPFDPNDTWYSYGPVITLHGQGMRNPNLTSGGWNATPLNPQTVCRAEQQTVVEAGVLSPPQISQGEAGQSVDVQMLPKLFYAELSGDCLWTRD
jgi:hypothetical protein